MSKAGLRLHAVLGIGRDANTQGSGELQICATPLELWLPTHRNMVVEGLHAYLWRQADQEFEIRFCHFPAGGEGARESCLSSRPLPLALCLEAGLEVHTCGLLPWA